MSVMRFLLKAAIAAIGIASILATGGGGSGPSACFVFYCDPGFPTTPTNPWTGGGTRSVSISPSYPSVQVGESVTFTATTSMSNPRFEWCRAPRNAMVCTSMPEATQPSYTLAAAALTDDDVRFRVTATGNEGSASREAVLKVSPLPGVVFQDGEFEPSGWVDSTVLVPAQGGPTAAISRQATGGNPGAYRTLTYSRMPTSGSAQVSMIRPQAEYSFTSQGAIDHVDFTMECATSHANGFSVWLLVEQADRRFIAGDIPGMCESSSGFRPILRPFLRSSDFTWRSGPPCASGERCPDFGATAPLARFGLMVQAQWPAGHSDDSIRLDNWKVTIWRK